MKLQSFSLVLFLTFVRPNKSLNFNPTLAVDFLNHYNLNIAIFLYCDKTDELIDGLKGIAKSEFKYFSYFDVSSQTFNGSESWRLMKFENWPLGVIFDVDCKETEEVFKECSRFSYFNASYNWLMMSTNIESSINLMKTQNINWDAEITLAATSDVEEMRLFDIYNPSSRTNGELVVLLKGIWSQKSGFNITLAGSKFDRRSNLNGTTLLAGVVVSGKRENQTIEQYLDNNDDPVTDYQHRYGYRIIKTLAARHNFTLFIRHVAVWRTVQINGSFEGVLGMFHRKEIDISITPFMCAVDRISLFEFSVITVVTSPAIIFRHPRSGIRNVFLQPLSPLVWAAMLVVLFIVTVLILISMRYQLRKTKIVSLPRAFILAFGIFCQQGFVENFRKLSTRLVMITTILLSLIIYQFYSSFIVSSLLIDAPKTINTVRKLIDSDLNVGIEDLTYNTDFFNTTNDKIALELYQKKLKKNNNFFKTNEGLKLMKQGGFAFHIDTAYGYGLIKKRFTDEEICELNEVVLFPPRPLGNVVAKRSPFRELMAVGLQRLFESGMMDYDIQKRSATKPKCVKSETVIKSIEIEETSVVFMLLAAAVITSFVVLVIEILHFKFILKK